MSDSLVAYSNALAEAMCGRGREMSAHELGQHMVNTYVEFLSLAGQQEVIDHAVGGGFAYKALDGRLFLLPDHTKMVTV